MSVRKKGNKWYCRFQIDGIRYERRCIGATDEKSAKKCEVVIMSEVMHWQQLVRVGQSSIC